MQKFRSALAMHHWTRLGRCPACMRTAFIFALGALATATAATIAGVPGPALFGAWLAAGGLTALWVGHVFMFSRHATSALAISSIAPANPSRRVWLMAFLRLLLVTATVTSLPRNLRAQGCDCFNDSNCTCPPDYPSCFFNPSTGEAICCGPSNVGCSGPSMTWCCPPGSQCYGSEGQCMANQ
jgi:hypothetical protein